MSEATKYPKCPGCNRMNPLKPWTGSLLHCVRGHVWDVKLDGGKRMCVCTHSPDGGAKVGDNFEWPE